MAVGAVYGAAARVFQRGAKCSRGMMETFPVGLNANKEQLSYNYLIEPGEHLLGSGRYTEVCMQYCNNFVPCVPNTMKAYEMLGHVNSWLLRNNEQAMEYYSNALKLRGGNKRIGQHITEPD